MKGLENLSHQKSLGQLGLFSLENTLRLGILSICINS